MENIQVNDREVTFDFKGSVQEAAKLRRKLMSDIKSSAIHKVTFMINTSSMMNEELAKVFGFLITIKLLASIFCSTCLLNVWRRTPDIWRVDASVVVFCS